MLRKFIFHSSADGQEMILPVTRSSGRDWSGNPSREPDAGWRLCAGGVSVSMRLRWTACFQHSAYPFYAFLEAVAPTPTYT